MDTTPAPPPSKSSVEPVPEELLQKLHDANAQFHKNKEQLEVEMDAPEHRHQERVSRAEEELLRTEREVEEVECRIKERLGEPSGGDA